MFKQKASWQALLLSFLTIFGFVHCTNPQESHRMRVAGFTLATVLLACSLRKASPSTLQTTSRGVSLTVFLVIVTFAIWRMSVTW